VKAIDIEHFQPLSEFTARMDRMVDYLKSSTLRPGVPGIFLPGELEYNRKQSYRREGIPLDQPTRDALRQEAETAGLAYDVER
jgi:LDH2 family malate/lactate/ureidoglycolate dehydrogenase